MISDSKFLVDKQRVEFSDLGKMDYPAAWALQTETHQALVARKKSFGWNRAPTPPDHRLYFVEHDHVYTLGKSGSESHLLLNEQGLKRQGTTFHRINRGGDITYHGPGQIVGYPILDLEWFFQDVRRYVSSLEEAVIRCLAEFQINAERYDGFTGVWLPPGKEGQAWRKICAIGVHISRWVTLHGFAFNVNTDLSYFRGIVPCGIASLDHEVTSLASELGEAVDMQIVKELLLFHLGEVFNIELVRKPLAMKA